MTKPCRTKTIGEILAGMSDQEMIEALRYIRDENGERVSLIELKHYLREYMKGRNNDETAKAEY